MSEFRILQVMRKIEWEKAKANLQSIKDTYYPDEPGSRYQEVAANIDGFIRTIEDEVGL